MGRIRVAAGAALVALSAAASPAATAAQLPNSGLEVESLEFVGNQAFPEDSLRLAIINRETECRPIFVPFCGLSKAAQRLRLGTLGLGFADDEEYLRPRELPLDVLRLQAYYYERGYRETRVDTTVARDTTVQEVRLTFEIEEGPPILIDSLAFFGSEVLGQGSLTTDLPVAVGDPLSTFLLEEARDTLLSRLRNEGYVHADVLRSHYIPTDRPHEALVTFDIDPGPRAYMGELIFRVTGPAQLSETVVRRMLPFQEGSLYREADIQQAQRNLFNLEIVLNALIAIDTVRTLSVPDTLVPLRIDVVTSTLHRVRVGGGWSMSDCMNGEARWASRNVFGGAQRLEVAGKLSNVLSENFHDAACPYSAVGEFGGINWSLSTELNFPWILSPRNSFTGSLFLERQSLQDVFIRRSVGLNLALTRSLAPRTPLVLFYRPQRSSLEAAGIFFCTSLLACSPEDVDVLADPNWLSPVGIGLTRERIDYLLNPSSGYTAHFEVESANALTGSDFSYSRVTADGTYYLPLVRETVLAARVRAGWVGAAEFGSIAESGIQIIPPQKRFFAGGSNSVRGFAQNRLGPSILTVEPDQLLGPARVAGADTVPAGPCSPAQILDASCDARTLEDGQFTPRPTGGTRLFEGSVEYRFPVARSFQGVTFLDFGQAWNEQSDVGLGNLEWTPGFGVRYFSPIGPLRLDLAYRFPRGQELSVVTSRIRPYVAGEDSPEDRLRLLLVDAQGRPLVDAEGHPTNETFPVPWIRQQELAFLSQSALFGEDRSFFSRLQIHLSIGQAF